MKIDSSNVGNDKMLLISWWLFTNNGGLWLNVKGGVGTLLVRSNIHFLMVEDVNTVLESI